MSPVRKIKVQKDRAERAVEVFKEILEKFGIQVVRIDRSGDNFLFTFDRDLTEEPQKLSAIKNVLAAKFPDHKITEVEESNEEKKVSA